MKRTLYKVVKADWGLDRLIDLYFETKEEADEFYEASNYVDRPVKECMSEEEAFYALRNTEFYFEPF